jgi:DNA invertase Pin-like site-specific DNA recombinase
VVLIYARGCSGNSLWDFCRRRGWDNEAQVVTGLDVLMRLVRAGKVEVLLCASLSGLGRNVPQLVAVLRDLAAHKTVLIIPGRIDTSKLSSKAFLNVLDAIEEFKHSAAVEAINAGLASAKRRGVKLGRPQTVNREAVK